MQRTLVFLVRHGEVENPGRLRYGRLPGFRLSARGHEQVTRTVEHLAQRVSDVAAVVTSPLERAVQTAEPIASRFGLPLFCDARVIEAASHFEGLPLDAPRSPRYWREMLNPLRPSWGEPFAELGRRMSGAIFDAARAHRGRAVVIVSHQSPIWVARAHLAGFHGPPWLLGSVRCHHASVSTLWFEGLRFVTWWYWKP